jgi:hypothetical protein
VSTRCGESGSFTISLTLKPGLQLKHRLRLKRRLKLKRGLKLKCGAKAAKQRKNTAPGVSPGCEEKERPSPEGAKETEFLNHVLVKEEPEGKTRDQNRKRRRMKSPA